tara:strand:- start:3 stop:194 length:192 start_codon:yes stop_codon:yes gene_type:complete
MTLNELLSKISQAIGDPIWELGEDSEGQIIIYTGLYQAGGDADSPLFAAEEVTHVDGASAEDG